MAARGHALVVAVHEFDDERLRQLRSPIADAEQLERVLRDSEIGGFEVGVVTNPLKGELEQTLDDFFRLADPNELLLLHVASHGLKNDRGGPYFAARNTNRDALDSTAIPAGWLSGRIADSPSRRKVVLLDCCYSGAFAPGTHALTALAKELTSPSGSRVAGAWRS